MMLIGSTASPFVRRIRILLENHDYEFKEIQVFSKEGQKELLNYGPIRRVPILIDNDNIINDSNLIHDYLNKNFELNFNEKKNLTYVNELANSGLILFQFQRFGLDPKLENELSKNHLKRISDILGYFEKVRLKWDSVGQYFYCILDWFSYREVYPWATGHSNLKNFIHENKDRPIIKLTDPRIAD